MLTLGNIEMQKKFASEQEEIRDIRSYIFQLYTELNYRLDDLDKRLKALEENEQ